MTAISDRALFLFGGLSVECRPMSKQQYSIPTERIEVNLFLFLNRTFRQASIKPGFYFPGDGWVLDVETKKWREIEHPYQEKPRQPKRILLPKNTLSKQSKLDLEYLSFGCILCQGYVLLSMKYFTPFHTGDYPMSLLCPLLELTFIVFLQVVAHSVPWQGF